jgi:serine phosphatase RsbU (regulator of sigma subunit)/anti-sigma regulatory factor (Ser/Thr protein kinase)
MTALTRPFRRLAGRSTPEPSPAAPAAAAPVAAAPAEQPGVAVEIPETDPLFAYLQSAPGPVDLAKLDLASHALQRLRDAGVALVVPLVTQGELIGTLNLGPRLSEQEYSSDDRRLLGTLAAQAAPAIRVAQLVREQAAEAAERERIDQELRLATMIQQQFLPKELPALRDWQVAAYYGPARAVGGDFYDVISLADGRIGLVVGDVTDKGVPAALVMARTQSTIRGEAPRYDDPGAVLERVNELLVPEMPSRMFVTCLYGILEPATGRFVFANAGHNLPYVRSGGEVADVRATGLPLGLMPGMRYDTAEMTVPAGGDMLLYSDGFVEAHGPDGSMFGFPRLRDAFAAGRSGNELVDDLVEGLWRFTGRDWDQEDDLTIVTLRRAASAGRAELADEPQEAAAEADERTLATFSIPGEIGTERDVAERVAAAVASLDIPPASLERLKTAVSEAAMNAIEYGSAGRPDVPVAVAVSATDLEVLVRITDRALSGPISDAEEPDIEAKLAGLQKPRGWGLFLIRHMVDRMDVTQHADGQTVTLALTRGEGPG